MDPLSVMASVAGLIGAAGKVGSVLFAVKSSIMDAPRLMDQMLSQVKDLEISLSAVQSFLAGVSSAPRSRISMIRVEQLVATLTEAVLTFSELDTLATSIAKDNGSPIATRLMYVWKEDTVASLMLRLERHKSSLSLMLNITQCESDLEAERSRETLQNLIEELLTQNDNISRRLRRIEDNFESRSIMTTCFRNGTIDELMEDEFQNENDVQSEASLGLSRFSILGPKAEDSSRNGFQVDLGTSRVYKRTELYESDMSFTSSVARTHAWSIFSGLSLSQVSMISVIALPLYLDEISNKELYTFNKLDHSNLEVTVSHASSGSTPHNLVANTAPSTASGTTISSNAESTSGGKLKKPRVGIFSRPKVNRGLTDSVLDTLKGRVVPIAPHPDARVEPPAVLNPDRPLVSPSKFTNRRIVPVLYKLIVLGDADVGKSCLASQFCLERFYEGFDPTIIEDSYRKMTTIDGQSCMLEILDTGGREEYTTFRDQWIRDGEGFVLVYSITSRYSFNCCRKLFHQIEETKTPSSQQPNKPSLNPAIYPVMLVGNKCDRVTEREVSTQEGYAMARELGCDFVEASALNCINIEKAFHDVVRALRTHRLRTGQFAVAARPRSSIGKPGETPGLGTSNSRKYRRS